MNTSDWGLTRPASESACGTKKGNDIPKGLLYKDKHKAPVSMAGWSTWPKQDVLNLDSV